MIVYCFIFLVFRLQHWLVMMMLFSLWCLAIDDCALFYFLCLQVTTLVGHDDAVQSVVFDNR